MMIARMGSGSLELTSASRANGSSPMTQSVRRRYGVPKTKTPAARAIEPNSLPLLLVLRRNIPYNQVHSAALIPVPNRKPVSTRGKIDKVLPKYKIPSLVRRTSYASARILCRRLRNREKVLMGVLSGCL
jgi:hypothetical protein